MCILRNKIYFYIKRVMSTTINTYNGYFDPTCIDVSNLPTELGNGAYGMTHDQNTGSVMLYEYQTDQWVSLPNEHNFILQSGLSKFLIIDSYMHTVYSKSVFPLGSLASVYNVVGKSPSSYYAVDGILGLFYSSINIAWALYSMKFQYFEDEKGHLYKVEQDNIYSLVNQSMSGRYYPYYNLTTFTNAVPFTPVNSDVVVLNDNILRIYIDVIEINQAEFPGISPWVATNVPNKITLTTDELSMLVYQDNIQIATTSGTVVLNINDVASPVDNQIIALMDGALFMYGNSSWIYLPVLPIENITSWVPTKFTDQTTNAIYYLDGQISENFDFCGKYLPNNNFQSVYVPGELVMTSSLVILSYVGPDWRLIPTNGNFVFRDKLSGNLYIIRNSTIQSTLSASQSANALITKYLEGFNVGVNPLNILETSNRVYNTQVSSYAQEWVPIPIDFNIPENSLLDSSNTLKTRLNNRVWEYNAHQLANNNQFDEGITAYASFIFWTMGTKRTITVSVNKEQYRYMTDITLITNILQSQMDNTDAVNLYSKPWFAMSTPTNGIFNFEQGTYDINIVINYKLNTNVQEISQNPYFAWCDITNVNSPVILEKGYFPIIDLDLVNVHVKTPIQQGQVIMDYTLTIDDGDINNQYGLILYPDACGLEIDVGYNNGVKDILTTISAIQI